MATSRDLENDWSVLWQCNTDYWTYAGESSCIHEKREKVMSSLVT